MTINDIGDVMRRQREYFASGATLPVKARVDALKRLYAAISAHENEICDALHADLGKSATESYMSEIGMVLVELRHMIKHLPSYAKDQRVSTPMSQFASPLLPQGHAVRQRARHESVELSLPAHRRSRGGRGRGGEHRGRQAQRVLARRRARS